MMKVLKREWTMDSGQKFFLKKNEPCNDYCFVKANKECLVEAVYRRVLAEAGCSWYEVNLMKKAELLEIAENNDLLIDKGVER